MLLENCKLRLSKQNGFEFSFAAVIGTRKYQEDYLGIITSDHSIAACVCDGMGGLAYGALASEMSVDLFLDETAAKIDSCSSETEEFYLDMLEKMDRDVHDIRNPDGSSTSAGCTIVSVFISDHSMKWLSVGDSSIFFVRKGEISRLNPFHNYQAILDEQLSLGRIDREHYARESRRGHALTSYLGMGGLKLAEICLTPIQMEKDDVIVLCSDGVTNYADNRDIIRCVSGKSANKAVDSLMSVLSGKSKNKPLDNASVIIIKIK